MLFNNGSINFLLFHYAGPLLMASKVKAVVATESTEYRLADALNQPSATGCRRVKLSQPFLSRVRKLGKCCSADKY